MSISDLGQMIWASLKGSEIASDEKKFLTKRQIGGVTLFRRNIIDLPQIKKLNLELSSLNQQNPLWIAVDQEGGRVARIKDPQLDLPAMISIGNHEQYRHLSRKTGQFLGSLLRMLHFNIDFAPVADIYTNPNNTVIGDRAFSHNPKIAAECVFECIRGLEETGIASCAKHFPGHGDTLEDSHYHLPCIDNNVSLLSNREFLPFQAAITANCSTIMTAHIIMRSIDSMPATLSKEILSGLLRDTLKYSGVIISDDLNMKALADHYSLEEIIHEGVLAGVDIFLICEHHEKAEQAYEILQKWYQKDTFFQTKANTSLERIQNMKMRFHEYNRQNPVDEMTLNDMCQKYHHEIFSFLRPLA